MEISANCSFKNHFHPTAISRLSRREYLRVKSFEIHERKFYASTFVIRWL